MLDSVDMSRQGGGGKAWRLTLARGGSFLAKRGFRQHFVSGHFWNVWLKLPQSVALSAEGLCKQRCSSKTAANAPCENQACLPLGAQRALFDATTSAQLSNLCSVPPPPPPGATCGAAPAVGEVCSNATMLAHAQGACKPLEGTGTWYADCIFDFCASGGDVSVVDDY